MKICFNQGCAEGCQGYAMMPTLEAAEKCGFDYVDIRWDLLDDYLKDHTAEELKAWFDGHRIKPFSYSAFFPFNWRKTEAERKELFDKLHRLLPVFKTIGLQIITAASAWDISEHASVAEIVADSVSILQEMADLCEPYGVGISVEFIGKPGFTVNRFDVAYRIVEKVNRESVGLAVDLFHFYAMGSEISDLAKCDGRRITNFHVNDSEDLPKGAAYFDDSKRYWPGLGKIDNKAMADALHACGFDAENVPAAVEVFRPEYYALSVEENVKAAYETTRAYADRFFG